MKKVVFLVAAAVLTAGSICSHSYASAGSRWAPEVTSIAVVHDTHGSLKVKGLCGMCKTRIEKAAKGVSGVTVATWDSKTGELHLHFDSEKTSLEAISKAIAKSGHDTEKDKADDKTYKSLPGCCKYRK
jgi:Cu(I)/Ag(I) efflux system membrane fusion protein